MIPPPKNKDDIFLGLLIKPAFNTKRYCFKSVDLSKRGQPLFYVLYDSTESDYCYPPHEIDYYESMVLENPISGLGNYFRKLFKIMQIGLKGERDT